MKVPRINHYTFKYGLNGISYNTRNSANRDMALEGFYPQIDDLSALPYIYPINFTSIKNSSKLRALFKYSLPCMYSGVPMIDPKDLSRLLKNDFFFRSSGDVVEQLSKYQESFQGFESQLFKLLKERSKITPNKNIQTLLKGLEPIYRGDLRKKQAPIFYKLTDAASELPKDYKYKFDLLMEETDKKLNEKPVTIPFSSYEFKYKLSKIAEDIKNGYDIKAQKVMKKLMKESQRFAASTVPGTVDQQKRVLRFLDCILKTSVLKNNEQLKSLINVSKSRLDQLEIIAPFSRKSFLYDLNSVLSDLPNKELRGKMLDIAQQLPTSNESFSAFVVKLAAEPPDKIGHRLMWPYLASVEHIFPKSCGGANELYNYGGATTKMNSDRKSIPFIEQLTRVPEARKNCQKYLDALIDLYHKGVFAENNIDPNYIRDFANTIYIQSGKTLKLDLSKMNIN